MTSSLLARRPVREEKTKSHDELPVNAPGG